jgi:hypothetical protein
MWMMVKYSPEMQVVRFLQTVGSHTYLKCFNARRKKTCDTYLWNADIEVHKMV